MQIILKQESIEQALKQFIASQGINLTNKIVTVDFTAGRKGSGLSAELNIEDATEVSTPSSAHTISLGVVTGAVPTPTFKDAADEVVPEPPAQPEAAPEREPEAEAAPAATEAQAARSSESLFA